jgi:gliding motility-associated-like protein
MLSMYVAYGQYTSRLGRFRVDEVKGCAPFTVTITDTNLTTTGECTPGKPCLMSAGNGTVPQPNQFTITYPVAGNFKLSILYQSIGADDIDITVDANIQPEFEIYTCAGLKTSIKITDKNYDQYFIDFNNDGIAEVAMPNGNNQTATHTYGAAGNFNISVRGKDINSADNCTAKVQPFNALNALPVPQLNSLNAINSTSLALNYSPQQNIQYKLEIAVNNSSTFQQFQTLYGVSTASMPNLNVEDNFYCFRLGSFDPCANNNVYSAPVCSQNFDLNIQSASNNLTWTTAPTGIINTRILKDDNLFRTLAGAPSAFTDTEVVCKTEYCYQVVNVYPNNVTSISLKKCGTSFITSTPTAIDNITSEVTEAGVTLNWQQNPLFTAATYSLLRAQNNNPFILLDQTTSNNYSDISYSTESNTCYRINYVDVCDNNSQQGALICPIRLFSSLDSKNTITLRWSRYLGFKNGIKNYRVQKFDKSGTLLSTINAGTDTLFVDDQPDPNNQLFQYKVVGEANDVGINPSISNLVSVLKSANIFYPSAFTPDGTGPVENDKFNVSGQFIVKKELKIFDRWGNLVFYSDKNEPWDGTNSGRAMPEGTYVWIANITDLSGQNFSENGTVVILRKSK